VRLAWLLALAALFAPAAARAQGADAGPGGSGEGGGDDGLPPMMRDPRQMSGMARGESNDPPGRLTVRAVQGPMKRTEFGDVKPDFPAGARIHLVGLGVGGKITVKTAPLDRSGRAVFDGLSTNSSQSYLVLAIFPRQGAEDRLVSRLVTMPPQVGMRMILAGEGVASGKPPVDDLGREESEMRTPTPEAGVVQVFLRGDTADVQEVELLQPGVAQPVARRKVEVVTVTDGVDGQVQPPQEDRALRGGVLEVLVSRRGKGVAGVPVELAVTGAGAAPAPIQTDESGRALFERLPAGTKIIARAVVQGRTFESSEFAASAPSAAGQRVRVEVDWREGKALQARFTGVAGGPDKVYYARAADQPRPYLSLPFQLTSALGVSTNIIVTRPIWFSLHGGASVEDDKLFFQVQISIYNASVTPYDPGMEGLRIPLPRGFGGASVEDGVTARVKVDEDRGLVWRGLLPPGERTFVAGFSLGAEDGVAHFDMPMPYGLFSGQLVFEQIAGVSIEGPPDLRQQTGRTDDGRPLVVFQNILIDPGERLKFDFAGLPQHPAWQGWLRVGMGLAVLGLLGWGVWGVARRGRRGGGRRSQLEGEREDLLQAVVELETDLRRARVSETVYQQRRAELMRQLEVVYAGLAAEDRAAAAGQPDARAGS
jgi:hypothetical protein